MYLMNQRTRLTEFVLESLKSANLVGTDSTVILTGSASIECARDSPKYTKYFCGQSDIDVLIVVDKDISFLKDIFSKNITKSFIDDEINVLNHSYQYGKGRNAINIKYIKQETFNEWTSLKRIHFKSFRKYSLSAKKPFMKCYGLDDAIIVQYHEKQVSDYFVLHYDIEFNEKYYLLDIHSMILFGTIIYGSQLMLPIVKFNYFFRSLLNTSNEKFSNLFKYFLKDKKSIDSIELKNLVKRFTEIDIDETLKELKDKGVIYDVKGVVKQDAQLATICWARSNPKSVFNFMCKVNMHITSKKFILLIDDVCPKVLYHRTDEEQEVINKKYKEAFPNCLIYFSSEIFKESLSIDFMQEFIGMMKKISLGYYIEFLPEKKRANLQSVNLGELIHTFCELFLINYAEQVLNVQTMIFGKFSQNILFLAKQQVFKGTKMSYIIIPRLNDDDMNSIFPKTS